MRWKSIPCLWQINLGETNKHKNHCWEAPLLSPLVLLRLVQQHGDFIGKATSMSLFPPQRLVLSCELDPALQLGNGPRLGKNPHSFLLLLFLFICKGRVVLRVWINPQSGGVGAKLGSFSQCRGGGASSSCPSPNHSLSCVLLENPLLNRRISKKISEQEKKQVKTSNSCPGHARVSY